MSKDVGGSTEMVIDVLPIIAESIVASIPKPKPPPPDYCSDSTERYPVVYSLHGMGGNETSDCRTFASVLLSGITFNAFPAVRNDNQLSDTICFF